jgi:hypothetical protein
MADSIEHSNESSSSKKHGKFVDQLFWFSRTLSYIERPTEEVGITVMLWSYNKKVQTI